MIWVRNSEKREIIKKSQTEDLQMKSSINEIKNYSWFRPKGDLPSAVIKETMVRSWELSERGIMVRIGRGKDPRWWQEGRSRQCELHKSKILLRHWSHTQQKKTTKKNQNSDTLNPQSVQSFSMPCHTEKTGGLPHCQMPAPYLLGRCRQTGEQVSGTWYSHSYPWDEPA
jgi:hypothetical protein